jgi:PEP-CTERM motif-containing protein
MITRKTIGIVFSAGVLALLTQSAAAAVIYSQDPTPDGDSYFSSIDGGSQNADTFVLAEDVVLNRIGWWGTATSSLDAFEVLIYADDGGTPALTPLLTASGVLSQTSTGLADSAGAGIFRYDLEGAFALLAGTYSLAVGNNGLFEWWWLSAAVDDSSFFRVQSDVGWETVTGDLAFRLETADPVSVPEPGALALLAFGITTLLAERAVRRRRGIGVRAGYSA